MANNSSSKRQSNIEWLRVIAMLMVVTLHAMGKGGLLGEGAYASASVNGIIAWLLESFSIVAVNLYVLISGFCLAEAEFKTGRLVNLIMEVLFYSLGGFFVFKALGVTTETDFYSFLSCALPVHMDTFWFITSYVVLYLLLPILVRALKGIKQEQLKMIIVLLLIYECGFKTFLPFAMGIEDNGYSFLWFIILFLTAAYFKKFGFGFLESKRKSITLFAVCCLLVFAEGFAIGFVSANFGKLELLERVSYDYNHLFVYLGAIGLFSFGINTRPGDGVFAKIGVFLGKYTLGVYLLHEHPFVRYEWGKWFRLGDVLETSVLKFLFTVFVAIFTVFVIGIAVDCVRTLVFKTVGKMRLFEPFKNYMKRMDITINGREDF